MDCQRCRGLMVAEHFEDLFEAGDLFHATYRRCVNCGELYDEVMLSHRKRQQDHRSTQDYRQHASVSVQ
ncbi:MAG: hypothetical protein U0236_03810 [Nitrospira sp.]